MASWEHVAFLAGSENRVQILETLHDRPRRQCELVCECGLSRSTVHRALDGLAEREWIHNEGGVYRLTVGGRLVLDQYELLETTIERVDEWGSFLQNLGETATTLPAAALDDAQLVSNVPENPHAAISHVADVFVTSDVDTFYGISPVVSPVLNHGARELATSGTEMEYLIDRSVLDASQSAYPDALAVAHSLDRFTLYLYPDELTFGLAVLDDRVLVSTYDAHGSLHECLDGTDEALVRWANDVYEDYRAAAEPIDAPEAEATPRQ